MPSINQIRFINVNYNNGLAHIFDKTFDFAASDTTLLCLENGGGKTVIIQTAIQAILPNSTMRNHRPFSDYLSDTASYILIEWLLDDRKSLVTTGLVCQRVKVEKRVQMDNGEKNSSTQGRFTTFVAPRELGGEWNINTVPATEIKNGRIRAKSIREFEELLDTAEKSGKNVQCFKYSSNSDHASNYRKTLGHYRIDSREWDKIILDVNKTEDGLDNYFKDQDTSQTVLQKTIIPTIEKRIADAGNVLAQIKDILKNQAHSRIRKEESLLQEDAFKDFIQRTELLFPTLDAMERAAQNLAVVQREGRGLLEGFLRKTEKLERDLEKIKALGDSLKAEFRYHERKKESYEYYEKQKDVQVKEDAERVLFQRLCEMEEKLAQAERELSALKCANIRDKIDLEQSARSKELAKLERLKLEDEEIACQVRNIDYSLHHLYRGLLTSAGSEEERARKDYACNEECIEALEGALKKYRDDRESLSKNINDCHQKIGGFQAREDGIQKKYPALPLERNLILRQYDPNQIAACQKNQKRAIDKKEEEVQQCLTEHGAVVEQICQLNDNIEPLEKTVMEAELSLLRSKEDISLYQTARERRQELFRKHSIDESIIFNSELALTLLGKEEGQFRIDVEYSRQEIQKIVGQITLYESGRGIAIPEELELSFGKKGIQLEGGLEWLKNYEGTTVEKEKILNKNPFLPYAIVVNESEYEQISRFVPSTFTHAPIPVILRDSLDAGTIGDHDGHIHRCGNVSFFMLFNEQLLDEQHLQAQLSVWRAELKKLEAEKAQIEEAIRGCLSDAIRIKEFHYRSGDGDRLCDAVESRERELAEARQSSKNNRTAIAERLQRKDALEEQNRVLSSELVSLKTEQYDLVMHLNIYEVYIENLADLDILEERMSQTNETIDRTDNELSNAREARNELTAKISQLVKNVQRYTEQARAYDGTEGEEVAGMANELEARRNGLMEKRGDEAACRENIDQIEKRLDDYKRDLSDFTLPEDAYSALQYDRFKEERQKEICNQLSDKVNSIEKSRQKAEKTCYGATQLLENLFSQIEERYEGLVPLTEITDTDFKRHKSELEERARAQQQLFSQQDSLLKKLDTNRRLLDELTSEDKSIQWEEPLVEIHEDGADAYKAYAELRSAYLHDVSRTKSEWFNALTDAEHTFIPKGAWFSKLFVDLLNDRARQVAAKCKDILTQAVRIAEQQMDKVMFDLQSLREEEEMVIGLAASYTENAYNDLTLIDMHSRVDLGNGHIKMMNIDIPRKEECSVVNLKAHIQSSIQGAVKLLKTTEKESESKLNNHINSQLSTYQLLDSYMGFSRARIRIQKLEHYRSEPVNWEDAVKHSDGEKFPAYFTLLCSLMSFVSGGQYGKERGKKVLILDNPFGKVSAEHLLAGVFKVAKNYNVQLICFTHIMNHAVMDQFDRVYSLRLEPVNSGMRLDGDLTKAPEDIHKGLESALFQIEMNLV